MNILGYGSTEADAIEQMRQHGIHLAFLVKPKKSCHHLVVITDAEPTTADHFKAITDGEFETLANMEWIKKTKI